MKTVSVNTSKPYKVKIGKGLVDKLAEEIQKVKNCKKIAIITDDNVGRLYGKKVESLLKDFEVCYFEFSNGEDNKSLATVSDILEFLAKNKLTRSDLIVALGGGIVGDVAGFAAASYLRGIDFVQIPTTLLAMVDSSVGGKTGVNLSAGKNLAGAFHQPCLVICDQNFLHTLPSEEIKNGLGEVIKYGCIADKKLFDLLCTGDIFCNIEEVIYTCISIKADFAARDEFDKGDRQKLNFGHTLGHSIEKATAFAVPHGQAVGIGMVLICRWAQERGLTGAGCAEEIDGLLKKFEMARKYDFTDEQLWGAAANDKKLKGSDINLVLLKDIGESYLYKTDVNGLITK